MNEEESSVEKMKKGLYARGKKPELHERRELHEVEYEDVKEGWEEQVQGQGASEVSVEKDPEQVLQELYEGHIDGYETQTAPAASKKKKSVTSIIIKIFFIASFLFFLTAVGIAAYYLIGGKNQVSCKNVDIAIAAPQAIASGKQISLDVSVTNSNPVPMRSADIEVKFPKGARGVGGSENSLTSSNKQVGTLEVNEQVRSSFQAILFGQEKSEQTIEAVVTYGIDDSNASFSCSKTHTVSIATAPVSLSVEGLEEISSGQEVELTITVVSNSEEVVPDQRLVIEYPFGFEFVSAEPEPMYEDNVWELGDIAPNKERVVVMRGTVQGQGTESRAINISVGEGDKVDKGTVDVILQKVQHPLLVTRPFLELSLRFNNNDANVNTQQDSIIITKLGKQLSGMLEWKNTLPDALHNLEIDLNLDGTMLDPGSVRANNGFFRSIDNTIVWTPQTTKEEFRSIKPGETGTLLFSFETKPFVEGSSVENPVLMIDTAVRALRISDNKQVPQNLVGQTKKRIVFDSSPTVDAYALYGIGPFTNTGPHPPHVDEKTTYTIAWDLYNTVNKVNGVTVRGVLPVYAQWLDAIEPNNGSVTFNPVTREVIWSIDSLEAGTGYKSQERSAAFQIAIVPSISQIDRRINLLENIRLQAVDEFTKNMVESEAGNITTSLDRDPFFKDKWSDSVME